MKLRTVTLGCKVNQYETEFVREGLAALGMRMRWSDEPADLCIVNTCTVTDEGDAKSRQAIRRLARQNPAAKIVVMGCYATRAPEEVAALPNVTEVRDRQARAARSARPVRRDRCADRHQRVSAAGIGPT